MEPWDFGWEAIAALAGVSAVIVASVLGWLGVRLAAKAVHRSKLDYVGQRADAVADQLEQLRILYFEFDTALLPFWPTTSPDWDCGEKPAFAPAQGKYRELQAACNSVSLAIQGLTATHKELGGSARAESVSLALAALDISTYIECVYFVNDEHPYTRGALNSLYEGELAIYEPQKRDMVRSFLGEVGTDIGIPNTVTSVSTAAFMECGEAIEKLVGEAFEMAGG